MSNNLEARNGLWYAVLVVPAEVRDQLGRFKFFQSLRTHSKAEAIFRAGPLLTKWRAEIRKARGQDFDPNASEAQRWKMSREVARDWEEKLAIDTLIEDRAQVFAKSRGIHAASNFYKEAMGLVTVLKPLYDDWKAQLGLAPKTVDQMSRDVERLVAHFHNLQQINPKAVKAWVDELAAAGATHASLKRVLGSARSFWKYLRATSVIELEAADPFAGMQGLMAERVERNKKERRAFTANEVASLYSKAHDDGNQSLADLIALGAYTGARIEELCSLQKKHVGGDSLTIDDSKTRAGIREVPIHPAIEGLVARLAAASKDGYLIPSTAGGQYSIRSDPLSKRFGRMKTAMGFGPEKVFHSIRKTVVTLMEQAGVSEGLAADIVGHEKATLTYGLYSEGSSLKQKLEAIANIEYQGQLNRP